MAVARAPRRLALPSPRRLPEKEQRADLRVLDRPPRSALVTTAFAVAALFVVFFALVVFHTVMLENQQRLDRLDSDVDAAQSRYEQLRLEVAQLEAPQRVVDAATQKLGMVPAGATTYLTPSAPAPPAPSTPTPADANDAAPTDGTPSVAAPTVDEWPQVKPYLGSTPR
jgi:cell division protein FtsL